MRLLKMMYPRLHEGLAFLLLTENIQAHLNRHSDNNSNDINNDGRSRLLHTICQAMSEPRQCV